MKQITMTDAQYIMLRIILSEADDARASAGCNDPDEGELGLFSVDERKEIAVQVHGEECDVEEEEGLLFNNDLSAHILHTVTENVMDVTE